MILMDSRAAGAQVISPAIAQRIKTTRNAEAFSAILRRSLVYRSSGGLPRPMVELRPASTLVVALGIHGQFIYVNSAHYVVIVKQWCRTPLRKQSESAGKQNSRDARYCRWFWEHG